MQKTGLLIKILSRETMDAYYRAYKGIIFKYVDVISVNDPVDDYLFEPKEHENLRSYLFSDVTPKVVQKESKWGSHWDYTHLTLFTRIQARSIVEFLMERDIDKPLLVHCFAGISRSGAIGAFAGLLYGYDFATLLRDHPHIKPNPWVLSLLTEVWENEYDGVHPGKDPAELSELDKLFSDLVVDKPIEIC